MNRSRLRLLGALWLLWAGFAASLPAAAGGLPFQATPPTATLTTLLGGSNWDTAAAIAMDDSGYVYVAGETPSADFPTTPGALSRHAGQIDAFVVKLDPQNKRVVYSVLLGGAGEDSAYGIAVEDGVAYVAGSTTSADFPGGGSARGESDAFVAAIDPSGERLLYAARLAGSDQDLAHAVAVENGHAYVTGITWSADFPASGVQADGDAFVARLDPAGATRYATALGGSATDAGFAIAVRDEEAFVGGQTWSWNFPGGGLAGQDDAFVARLDGAGGVLGVTLVGGRGEDSALGIALDGQGRAWLTGSTASADLPASRGSLHGSSDAFLAQVDSDGALRQTYYLGGVGADEGRGIAAGEDGGLLVSGATRSTDFPVTADALQRQTGGGGDGFLAILAASPAGAYELDYATYIGGASGDEGNAVAEGNGGAAVAGASSSTDFPVTAGALQNTLSGGQDAFVTVLALGSASPLPQPTATTTQQPQATARPAAADTPVPQETTPLSGALPATAPATTSVPTAIPQGSQVLASSPTVTQADEIQVQTPTAAVQSDPAPAGAATTQGGRENASATAAPQAAQTSQPQVAQPAPAAAATQRSQETTFAPATPAPSKSAAAPSSAPVAWLAAGLAGAAAIGAAAFWLIKRRRW